MKVLLDERTIQKNCTNFYWTKKTGNIFDQYFFSSLFAGKKNVEIYFSSFLFPLKYLTAILMLRSFNGENNPLKSLCRASVGVTDSGF